MDAIRAQRPARVARALDNLLPDGSVILFDPETRDMLVLNPLAALIWELSTGEQTIAALIQEVQTLFPEQEGVDRDVLACIDELAEKGFITLAA